MSRRRNDLNQKTFDSSIDNCYFSNGLVCDLTLKFCALKEPLNQSKESVDNSLMKSSKHGGIKSCLMELMGSLSKNDLCKYLSQLLIDGWSGNAKNYSVETENVTKLVNKGGKRRLHKSEIQTKDKTSKHQLENVSEGNLRSKCYSASNQGSTKPYCMREGRQKHPQQGNEFFDTNFKNSTKYCFKPGCESGGKSIDNEIVQEPFVNRYEECLRSIKRLPDADSIMKIVDFICDLRSLNNSTSSRSHQTGENSTTHSSPKLRNTNSTFCEMEDNYSSSFAQEIPDKKLQDGTPFLTDTNCMCNASPRSTPFVPQDQNKYFPMTGEQNPNRLDCSYRKPKCHQPWFRNESLQLDSVNPYPLTVPRVNLNTYKNTMN